MRTFSSASSGKDRGQWPATPVFNFLIARRAVHGLGDYVQPAENSGRRAARPNGDQTGLIADIVNDEFEKLFEANNHGALVRELLRNTVRLTATAAFTPGGTRRPKRVSLKRARFTTEILENTRVHFATRPTAACRSSRTSSCRAGS